MNIKSKIINKKPKFVVKEAKSKLEAFGFMLSGVWYFLEHDFLKTMVTIVIICGSSLVVVGMSYLYLKSDSITIQRAEPVKKISNISYSTTNDWLPISMAQSDDKYQYSIVINGNFYGYYDNHYRLWKLLDKDAILIYDQIHDEVFIAPSPAFSKNKLEKN